MKFLIYQVATILTYFPINIIYKSDLLKILHSFLGGSVFFLGVLFKYNRLDFFKIFFLMFFLFYHFV
ncbi:hypothetical protein C1645_779760 [Glomus cerebriforme]|uniref:Uncharacterized protein n=1 Tax=Glomus cerebriforme TaxID=658196 RepID=A0A397SUI1_9GLOM|nr:hypothetical protein C1645_779760 [Glomus cerebriforme]